MDECWQQKYTQHAPFTKTECDYLNGWIKKRPHTQKSHQNGEPQRYSWGTQKKKEKIKKVIPSTEGLMPVGYSGGARQAGEPQGTQEEDSRNRASLA